MKLVFSAIAVLFPTIGYTVDLYDSSRFSPSDYYLKSQESYSDPVFDNVKPIDLGVDLGVGSDCGRIDFTSTLRASLRNILDAKYFGDMGKDILAGSPMLLACYFSPTWCAILKDSQVKAHWLSQMRLDQCSLIDKYTDSRVEDFYQERQKCVRKAIEENGGDLEHAMESCRGSRVWDANLTNWAGKNAGETASENRLIGSSAKWAGIGGGDSEKPVNLVKALVGDTIVSHGNVSIDYGGRPSALTPRTYLQSIEKATYDELCGKLVKRFDDPGETPPESLISEAELKSLSPGFSRLLIDKQTLRSLSLMGPRERSLACRKLSDAVSLSIFSADTNRSLDVLTTLAQNPNLPDNRKQEIAEKRRALKDSIEMTVSLREQRNDPLNKVLSQINQEGRRLEVRAMDTSLSGDVDAAQADAIDKTWNNCADGVFCDSRR